MHAVSFMVPCGLEENAANIMKHIRCIFLYRFTIQVPCGFPQQWVCDSIWTRPYAWCLWGTIQLYYLNKRGWSRYVVTTFTLFSSLWS